MPPQASRVIIITGGSSGIGLCTALLFARRGWRVGLIARSETGLAAAAERIRAAGGRVATASADVSDSTALAAAATRIESELGPMEVWVNNAGVGMVARFTDTDERAFHRVVHVTFLGQVNGTRIALASMTPRNRGTIVGIASGVAYRAVPMMSAYSASKWALRGFYEAVRAELMHDRIRVHLAVVDPPSVNTPFFSHAPAHFGAGHEGDSARPPPPVYEPELIAEGVWLAVSEQRREVRVSGSTEQLAVMNALMPGVLDRIAALVGFVAQRTSRRDVAALRAPALYEGNSEGVVHGPFTREARASSGQMWLQRNRLAVGLAGLGVAIALKPARAARRAVRRR